MVDRAKLWEESGLRPGQFVQCVVTSHRDRYGVDVEIVEPLSGRMGFIDFTLLRERGKGVDRDAFPRVGTRLKVVVVDFAPNGELRLNARPSAVSGQGGEVNST
jgi:hypothetical protein